MGVVSLSVFAVAELLITVDVRRQVEKEADKSMLSALRTVLSTVCDVALELDSELRVADDAPALAALLFRNPSRSLRGAAFTSLIPSAEDQTEFVRRMRNGPSNSVSMADVFHTHLQDTDGSNINTEVFSVPLQGLDKRPRYILGLRELSFDTPQLRDITSGSQSHTERRRSRKPPEKGTPSSLERCQLNASHEIPSSESTPRSDSGGSDSGGAEWGTIPPVPVGSASALSDSADAEIKVASFIPTTLEAKKQTLLYTMMYWKSKRHGCCPMHSNLEDVADVILTIMNMECCPRFLSGHGWQCKTCGILDESFKRGGGKRRCVLCQQIREMGQSRPTTNTGPVGGGPQPCSFGKVQL